MSEFENLVRKMRAYQIAGQICTIDRTKARILEKEVDKYLKEKEQDTLPLVYEDGRLRQG